MSTRPIHQARSNAWQSAFVASSASGFSVTTDDPSVGVVTLPMPTLDIVCGGKSNGAFAATRRTLAAPTAFAMPKPAPLPEVPPEPEGEREPDIEARQEPELAPETKPEAEAVPEPETKPETETDEKSTEPSNRLELIIDSLVNHTLTEPIPVSIDPLGDSVFTATVHSLEMSATGNSIGEALLVLKEQIEQVYDDLNKRNQNHLSSEDKTRLQMLHTYIAPPAKRSWY